LAIRRSSALGFRPPHPDSGTVRSRSVFRSDLPRPVSRSARPRADSGTVRSH